MTDIVIGQTAPLTGSEGEYGQRLSRGLQLAFAEANAMGGIGGRNITLKVLDDAHNTTRAVENVRQLLTTHRAMLLAGLFEAASLSAVLAMDEVSQHVVPIVGPYTGVALAREPFRDQVINVRASTSDEVIAQGAFLVETLQVRRVACVYWASPSGHAALGVLQGSLAYTGKALVSSAAFRHPVDSADVAAAIQAIVGNSSRPQAIVLATLHTQTLAFLTAYWQHPLADPRCYFLLLSQSLTPSFAQNLNHAIWPNLHIFQTVPTANDDEVDIIQRVRRLCSSTGDTSDTLLIEGYVTGRLIVDVLRGIRGDNFTGAAFLDEVYSARLFVIDGLTLGLYSRSFPGCSASLCACNGGLRDVFLAEVTSTGTLTPNTKASHGENSFRYPITQCTCSFADQIHPTLAFAQLIPADDAVGRAIALEIGDGITVAMEEANEAQMFGHRELHLIQVEYSGVPILAVQALTYRYPLLAILGSVVPSALALRSDMPTIATYEMALHRNEDAFAIGDLRVQPSTPLELMALASFAVEMPNCPIHLRAPMTEDGRALLALMLKSVHTFQVQPASQRLYSEAEVPFSDIVSGCVLLVATDTAAHRWLAAMEALPQVSVLTLSWTGARMLAANATVRDAVAAGRFLYSTLFQHLSDDTTRNGTKSDSWLFGHVSLELASQALRSSGGLRPDAGPQDLLTAWYQTKLLGFEGTFFGPYLSAQCVDAEEEDCECSNGARTFSLRSLTTRSLGYTYSSKPCYVQYVPLEGAPDRTWVVVASVVASVGGAGLVLVGMWVVAVRGRRNNRTAPKDPARPFCILFTDIQASTHLWATASQEMAAALNVHHSIIRQLIISYGCYEVKTIGDSFMCAAQCATQAVGLALAIQTKMFEHDWGTTAFDEAYRELVPEEVSRGDECWNGLRVRVGIHLGHGDITLDPVSQGYDYYGTVVNTAARIESVCHGGQVGVSRAVYNALGGSFPNVVWTDLGPHTLRGLQEPVHLYQALPEGPLARRGFPQLRLDKAHVAEEAEEAEDLQLCDNLLRVKSVGHQTAHSTETEGWASTHPLVQSGAVSVEDLRRHHAIALSTLSTLLTMQTQKFKEVVLRGFCERLHVPFRGTEEVLFQRSLHGVVLRVLPATLMAALAGVDCSASLPTSEDDRTGPPFHRHQVYVSSPSRLKRTSSAAQM
eukprot:GGOE01064703.1.p1 GENE.GGOE01064703.1~~GGOE01064703.1.p1  ORF type:complete len:1199 (-),score=364.34 GGOE01064703.1:460-3975(-)